MIHNNLQIKKFLVYYLFFLFFSLTLSFTIPFRKEQIYPQNYFRSPINGTLRISGTFGELRSNHFHAGLDIKSPTRKSGSPLFAAADGYVSRIKFSAKGYGKALYIDHPNGYTTVYAHMQKYTPYIEKLVKEKQYKIESAEVNIYPKTNKITFLKGQKIGLLGNSGSSNGPHVHFEIRKTKTETPLNPLLFGIKVADTQKPSLKQIRIYGLDERLNETCSKVYPIKTNKFGHHLGKDTIFINAWRVGVATKAFDQLNGASNLNGIYKQEVFINDSLVATFSMNAISFDETRFINAHIDYENKVNSNSYYHKSFQMPGNKLKIYNNKNKGIIKIYNSKAVKCSIIVSDFENNQSKVSFYLKRKASKKENPILYNYLLPFDEDNMIQQKSIELLFLKGTFYEDIKLKYHQTNDQSQGIYSTVHHIHNNKTPLHQFFDIKIKPFQNMPDSIADKAFIAYCNDASIKNIGGLWEDGFLKSKAYLFGNYCIMTDLIPPKIKPINWTHNLSKRNHISFTISDNIKGTKKIEALTYRATIDGKWVLMTINSKGSRIKHQFDEKTTKGNHLFKLELKDSVGNISIFEKKFKR